MYPRAAFLLISVCIAGEGRSKENYYGQATRDDGSLASKLYSYNQMIKTNNSMLRITNKFTANT